MGRTFQNSVNRQEHYKTMWNDEKHLTFFNNILYKSMNKGFRAVIIEENIPEEWLEGSESERWIEENIIKQSEQCEWVRTS